MHACAWTCRALRDGVSERSSRLADDLKVTSLAGPARVLAEEAVRIVERLDNLDRSLRGDADAWLDIVTRMPETVAEVTVDKLLGEVRQQGLALATVLKTLAALTGDEAAVPTPVVDTADEVKKRREEKRAAARLAAGG